MDNTKDDTEAGVSAGGDDTAEHVVRWQSLAAETGANGVSRTRLDGEGVSLVRIELPAGTVAAEHAHAHEQFVEVLAGAGALTTPAGTREFAAGDVFRFPTDTPHSATFTADTVLLEINVTGEG